MKGKYKRIRQKKIGVLEFCFVKKKNKHPKSSKKGQYKITNWSSYNQSLKHRGSLEVWIDKEAVDHWYYQGGRQRGSQFIYSDACIELAATLRSLYHLPYRQLTGFMTSVVNQLGWNVLVPDYTVINRRVKRLQIESTLQQPYTVGKKYILIDSTGLKVYGEGEWKVRQHGWSQHRTWRKLHVTVDEASGIIESCELTTNGIHDADMVEPLIAAIHTKQQIEKMGADGSYDKRKVYACLGKYNIIPVIPPQKNARISQHGNYKQVPYSRDINIRAIRKQGRRIWKQQANYHKRSLVETGIYRYKTIFGSHLQSRETQRQKVEVKLKCKLLNKMTQIGMPITICVKKAA